MNPRIRIALAVGLLFVFSFIIWKPQITGFASGGEPETVVVVLRAHSGSEITGASVFDESVSSDELRVAVTVAKDEVLSDVNSPSFVQRLMGDTEPDVVAERSLELVPAMVVEATPEGIAELESHPLVVAVYPNVEFELALLDSVPMVNADDVQNLSVNDISVDGSGRSVCVIDTGILPHQDFQNRIVDQKCFCQGNCCPNGQSSDVLATDVHPIKHGTHVSGIIGANGSQYKGVAPGVNIVAVKVCNSSCSLADIYSGIDYCLQKKDEFNVVAISGSIGDGGNYQSQGQCPTYFDSAINAAFDEGIVSVFAAGNNNYPNGVSYPGCTPNGIAVGAIDKMGALASFTNRGPLLEVLAPGVGIVSTVANNGYGTLSGTSQATPHVSGIVALLSHYASLRNVALNASSYKPILMDTGILHGSGFKRVDALAAVLSLYNNTPPVPVISSPLNDSNVSSPVLLQGDASDAEDGNLTNLTWSSDVDGILGAGNTLEVELSAGAHLISLTATDSSSEQVSVSVAVFVAGNSAPVVTIFSPVAENVTNPVLLQGDASDAEDGNLINLTWSSDVDGILGYGENLSVNLSLGVHEITLMAVDSENASSFDSVSVLVYEPVVNSAPAVSVLSPLFDSVVQSPVNFSGIANDSEDGILVGYWFEDNVSFGFGDFVKAMSPGFHSVTFSANDSQGLTNSTIVNFTSWTCHTSLYRNNISGVDIGDFVSLLTGFASESIGCTANSSCVVELDGNTNGVVDIGDIVYYLGKFVNSSLVDKNNQSC